MAAAGLNVLNPGPAVALANLIQGFVFLAIAPPPAHADRVLGRHAASIKRLLGLLAVVLISGGAALVLPHPLTAVAAISSSLMSIVLCAKPEWVFVKPEFA